jgi:hypothetical protein
VGELRGQGVEQFSRSEALVSGLHPYLSFLDHVYELNPNECVLSSLEGYVANFAQEVVKRQIPLSVEGLRLSDLTVDVCAILTPYSGSIGYGRLG